MAKSSADKSNGEISVYLFFDHGGCQDKSGHTFYKIDLPPLCSILNSSSSSSSSSSGPPVSINPILEFSRSEYPRVMACARLASKFFFFGGFFLDPMSPPPPNATKEELTIDLLNQGLPPHVYIFDTAADGGGTSIKPGPPMASGKSSPIVFVAKGMIYVLSTGRSVSADVTLWGGNPKTLDWDTGGGDLMSHVKLFERYDPAENKWKVLDDSPLHSLSYLTGYLLLEDQHKVVISSWCNRKLIHLVYDLDEDLWLSSSSLIPSFKTRNMLSQVNQGSCEYVGGFCYAAAPYRPIKFGPFQLNNDDEDPAKISISTMSLVDPHDVFPLAPGMDANRFIHHLGRGYFIIVSSSQALINNDFDIPDEDNRIIIINIFKEVEAEVPGESRQVATAASFNAKIVFSQNYVSKTDTVCGGQFLSCFVVQSPVLNIKEPIMNNEET